MPEVCERRIAALPKRPEASAEGAASVSFRYTLNTPDCGSTPSDLRTTSAGRTLPGRASVVTVAVLPNRMADHWRSLTPTLSTHPPFARLATTSTGAPGPATCPILAGRC